MIWLFFWWTRSRLCARRRLCARQDMVNIMGSMIYWSTPILIDMSIRICTDFSSFFAITCVLLHFFSFYCLFLAQLFSIFFSCSFLMIHLLMQRVCVFISSSDLYRCIMTVFRSTKSFTFTGQRIQTEDIIFTQQLRYRTIWITMISPLTSFCSKLPSLECIFVLFCANASGNVMTCKKVLQFNSRASKNSMLLINIFNFFFLKRIFFYLNQFQIIISKLNLPSALELNLFKFQILNVLQYSKARIV